MSVWSSSQSKVYYKSTHKLKLLLASLVDGADDGLPCICQPAEKVDNVHGPQTVETLHSHINPGQHITITKSSRRNLDSR